MIPSAENLRARSMARLSMGATPQGQDGEDGKSPRGGGRSGSGRGSSSKANNAGGDKK
jgi:hypothetical protein